MGQLPDGIAAVCGVALVPLHAFKPENRADICSAVVLARRLLVPHMHCEAPGNRKHHGKSNCVPVQFELLR